MASPIDLEICQNLYCCKPLETGVECLIGNLASKPMFVVLCQILNAIERIWSLCHQGSLVKGVDLVLESISFAKRVGLIS